MHHPAIALHNRQIRGRIEPKIHTLVFRGLLDHLVDIRECFVDIHLVRPWLPVLDIPEHILRHAGQPPNTLFNHCPTILEHLAIVSGQSDLDHVGPALTRV